MRSFFKSDYFVYAEIGDDGRRVVWTQNILGLGRGGVGYRRFVQWVPYDVGGDIIEHPHWVEPAAYPALGSNRLFYGFQFERSAIDGGESDSGPQHNKDLVVTVPIPVLILIFFAGSMPYFFAWRQRKRRRSGQCATCGYDLRATANRCPECGAVPDAIVSGN